MHQREGGANVMISFNGISKTYKVAKRKPGLKAALKSIAKRDYTYIEALKNVSFSIERGEIIGYIGPNGAGKSTTIKILSGILVPTSGTCTILGQVPWNNRIEHVKNIGVVFGQRSQLMWDIPVIDSFELLRDIYRVSEAQYKKNLDELVGIFNLVDFINTPVRQLSLGQRMRCEIAASLLHSPQILFLDEPTIGLDAVSKVAVRNFIKRINKENDVTVVLTTHDMGDVEALTDRVMLIGKGEILYNGSFNHMKSKYNTVNILTIDYDASQEFFTPEHTTLLSHENGRAVLSVDTEKAPVSKAISLLTQSLTVYDIAVQSRPIEEIIAEVYKEFSI
jgi:ABC-2 type transport system ATP-binding protein